jgi:hypothetical protein
MPPREPAAPKVRIRPCTRGKRPCQSRSRKSRNRRGSCRPKSGLVWQKLFSSRSERRHSPKLRRHGRWRSNDESPPTIEAKCRRMRQRMCLRRQGVSRGETRTLRRGGAPGVPRRDHLLQRSRDWEAASRRRWRTRLPARCSFRRRARHRRRAPGASSSRAFPSPSTTGPKPKASSSSPSLIRRASRVTGAREHATADGGAGARRRCRFHTRSASSALKSSATPWPGRSGAIAQPSTMRVGSAM